MICIRHAAWYSRRQRGEQKRCHLPRWPNVRLLPSWVPPPTPLAHYPPIPARVWLTDVPTGEMSPLVALVNFPCCHQGFFASRAAWRALCSWAASADRFSSLSCRFSRHGFVPMRIGQLGHCTATQRRTSAGCPAQQSRQRIRMALMGDTRSCPSACSSSGDISRESQPTGFTSLRSRPGFRSSLTLLVQTR